MKKILLATALTFAATTAFAGAVSDPIVESEVIVADTASSAGQGWIIPLFFLLLLIPFLNSSDPVPTETVLLD